MSEQTVEVVPELLDTSLIERRKTPVVLQSEAMECGLACLSMVMSSYGRSIDLPALRNRYPASLRGISFATLGGLADREGFLLTPYQAAPDQIAELKLPGILFWNNNHFVVLTEYEAGKRVTIHDPAVGVRRMGWAEFVASFSGACCELEPLASMQRTVVQEKLSMFSILKKTHGYTGLLAKMGLLALVLELLMLVSPLLLQTIVDEVIPVRDEGMLWSLAAGFAGVAVIKAGVSLVHGWLGMSLTGLLAVTMKSMTFRHLLKLPLTWFEKRGIGTATARFRSLDNIRNILSDNILMTLVDSLVAIVMVVLLLFYEWRLALLTIVLGAITFGVTLYLYKRFALAANEGIVADAEENRILVETLSAIPAIKMYGQEQRQLHGYRSAIVNSTNRMLDMLRVKTWNSSMQMLLVSVGDVVIVSASAYMVLTDRISLGVLFGFYAYKQILADKLNTLGAAYFQFRLLSVYTSNVADVLLGTPEKDTGAELRISARPTLQFDNIEVTYDEGDAPVLKNFSLSVAPGEIVGVTGPSGGGKSTLVKLLLGALAPRKGRILLDREDLAAVAPQQVRAHVSVVLQSDQLLTGTLLQNVTMFDPAPDVARAEAAIIDAALASDIARLPNGLHTFIQGHASTLSGGQQQRLLLARAFYKNAPLLVLDEATSALDVDREVAVCEAIRRKGLTTIMVAHRQETLARCDRVVTVGITH